MNSFHKKTAAYMDKDTLGFEDLTQLKEKLKLLKPQKDSFRYFQKIKPSDIKAFELRHNIPIPPSVKEWYYYKEALFRTFTASLHRAPIYIMEPWNWELIDFENGHSLLYFLDDTYIEWALLLNGDDDPAVYSRSYHVWKDGWNWKKVSDSFSEFIHDLICLQKVAAPFELNSEAVFYF